MQNSHVSIIVLNYNGFNDTVECIQSLLQLHYPTFSIIVVDNLSTDNSFEQLLLWANKNVSLLVDATSKNNVGYWLKTNKNVDLHFLQSGKNGGYAYGNNIGIKYAEEAYHSNFFWLLNNDTIVNTNSLLALVNCAKTNPSSGCIGSLLYYYHKPNELQHIYGGYNYKWGLPVQLSDNLNEKQKINFIKKTVAYVHGASMFIPKTTIARIGVLNEDYFFYFEELDYAERLKQANLIIAICEQSIVYHKNGEAFSLNQKHSAFVDFHFVKSKLIFTKLYNKKNLFTNYITIILLLTKRVLHLEWRCAGSIIKVMISKKAQLK